MGRKTREEQRQRRHRRIRSKISGTAERPRLNVYRSLANIYAQVIDDETGHTIASASTIDREVAKMVADKNKLQAAQVVGKIVAERAKALGVNQVVFDRGGYKYHGRVKALADASREAGLEF